MRFRDFWARNAPAELFGIRERKVFLYLCVRTPFSQIANEALLDDDFCRDFGDALACFGQEAETGSRKKNPKPCDRLRETDRRIARGLGDLRIKP